MVLACGQWMGAMSGKPMSELTVGMAAELSRTYDEWDIFIFAAVTGDLNPAHTDEAFAGTTPFHGRVAHGMLTSSLISAVLGTQLPGPGTIYLSQELKFRRPVKIGDTITARAEVVELLPEKNIARLRTTCVNQWEETVLEGEAVVMPSKQPALGPAGLVRPSAAASPKLGIPVLSRVEGVVGQKMSSVPVSVSPSTTLAEARALLRGHRIRHLVVGGERVDLGAITCALLNIVARMDHICAPKAASVLNELVASADKQLVILPGGHVGIVSGTGALKYLWPTIGDWLSQRSGEAKPAAAIEG